MSGPLCVDLFCGLGGWSDGFLAEGYEVVGFDIEQHVYGEQRYRGQLVLQDVLTLHGSQFRDAIVIVASPPCQEYSYMAMPWSRAKQIAREYRDGTRNVKDLTALFDACFRIQREASIAAGRHVPMVVENVRGAQEWVGRANWHFGSYYLWGDVPALMPFTHKAVKVPSEQGRSDVGNGVRFTSRDCGNETGVKVGGLDWNNRAQKGQAFNTHAERATKNTGGSWFNIAHNTTSGVGRNPDGRKVGGSWWHDSSPGTLRAHASRSTARKAASARIAMIPFPLASHIARCFLPPTTDRLEAAS